MTHGPRRARSSLDCRVLGLARWQGPADTSAAPVHLTDPFMSAAHIQRDALASKPFLYMNVKRASIREQSDRTVVVFPFSPGVASPSFNFNLPLTHRTCSEERGWESAEGTGSARCARGTNEGAGSAHVVLVRRQALSSATLL